MPRNQPYPKTKDAASQVKSVAKPNASKRSTKKPSGKDMIRDGMKRFNLV